MLNESPPGLAVAVQPDTQKSVPAAIPAVARLEDKLSDALTGLL
jgi:hypothetical protein